MIEFAAALAWPLPTGMRATSEMAIASCGDASPDRAIHGSPSWSAIATQPTFASCKENDSGSTCHHAYPDASTGPPTTRSSVPSGNRGSYLTESSLTPGAERTRSASDTVTTAEPMPIAGSRLAAGVVAGEAESVGDGVRLASAECGEVGGVAGGVPQATAIIATARKTHSFRICSPRPATAPISEQH